MSEYFLQFRAVQKQESAMVRTTSPSLKAGHARPNIHDVRQSIFYSTIIVVMSHYIMLFYLQACLLSDEEGISKLTPYGTQIWSPDVWSNSDRLTLALEPECAAIYCKNVSNDHIAYISAVKKIPENVKSYLILDIGGGTTDITALTRVNDDSYEVIVPPTGNVFGGNKVNQQFEEFLEKTVQDPGFKKILKEAKKSRRYEECKAMLQKIVYHDFETIKVRFGEREGYVQRESTESTAAGASAVKYHAGTHPSALAIDDIRFELPRKFLDFYKAKKIEKELKKGSGVGIIQGKLNISSTKMASFFEPVLQKMVDCVTNIANENGPFDIAFVAGGFGGCKYVYSYLRTKLDEKLPLFVPADHKLAVSMGAVLYARAPEVITIRTMDASYGIRVSKTFDKEKHDRRHSYVGEDGNPYCGNIFKSFVAKGDKVKTTEEFTIEVTPQDHSDTEARVSIYRSSNPDVKYTTDEKTHKIGEIRLNVPNPDNLPVADRKIAVTMNLSSTEIKVRVRALYLSETSPPVTAVLDFLTK